LALAIPEDGLRLGERSPAHHAARQGAERAGGEHIGAALPFIEGGRIRPIGVTSLTRVSALPDVPAIAEHPPLAGFELVNRRSSQRSSSKPASSWNSDEIRKTTDVVFRSGLAGFVRDQLGHDRQQLVIRLRAKTAVHRDAVREPVMGVG